MPHLDHTGPEGKASKTGRKLGDCKVEKTEQEFALGEGMSKRRKTGGGNKGLGKRLQSSKLFNNHNIK